MQDPTEYTRRRLIADGQPEQALAEETGPKWTTTELQRDFTVVCFAAPFVIVTRKSDGVDGTLEFAGDPRYYFGFRPT